MSGEAEIPDGLAAYAKALQRHRKLAEPISDEELQEVRGYVERTIRSQELHNLLLKGPCAAGLIARIDAAESRVVELQRELAEIREKIQDAEMEAREEPCST